jgi:hypothetical protein
MFLYRTQPKSTSEYNIINLKRKQEMMHELLIASRYKSNHRQRKRNDFITLLTDGCLLDGMLTLAGYDNILVVTSFEDRNYDRLRDRTQRPVNSAGDHMFPIVNSMNGSHGNIYATSVPNGDSFFTHLYGHYNINMVDCDSYFKVDNDFKLRNVSVKFDAVVLLGCESIKKGNFRASDVKAKFAKYCIEDFDMIDVYRGDRRKLTGGTKSITDTKKKMIECVNTPIRVYDEKTRLNVTKDDANWQRTRPWLQYMRLAMNIESLQNYYKVY